MKSMCSEIFGPVSAKVKKIDRKSDEKWMPSVDFAKAAWITVFKTQETAEHYSYLACEGVEDPHSEVFDDPSTDAANDHWLHPCQCVPAEWGSLPPAAGSLFQHQLIQHFFQYVSSEIQSGISWNMGVSAGV